MADFIDADDWRLLHDYARTGSHAAFDVLVKRHAGLVYGTARRRVGSADLADDVTQATFIILARKAAAIGQRQSLPAWLFRTARYASIDALRRRRTRQRHERAAAIERPEAAMPSPESNTSADIAPHLDAALDLLSARDREAILLRFFEDQTLEQIAGRQRVAASTVQRRLQHALSRLSHELKRRGVAPAPAALVGALTAFGLTPAPASATVGVTALATAAGALPATTAGPIGLAKGTIKTMTMLKLKLVAAAVAAAVTVGAGGVAITAAVAQSKITPIPPRPAPAAKAPAIAAVPTTGDGVDFARQFTTEWWSAQLTVSHFNPAAASGRPDDFDSRRDSKDARLLQIVGAMKVIDPTHVIGFNRFNSVAVTRIVDDAGHDLSGLIAANSHPEPWYSPLPYVDDYDQAANRFVSKLGTTTFYVTLNADSRLPTRLASVEGTLDVLTCQRIESVDVPLVVGEKFTEVLPGQGVRFARVTSDRYGVTYEITANGSNPNQFMESPIKAGGRLPERMLAEKYLVDAAGRPVGEHRKPFGSFASVERGSGNEQIRPGEGKPVAMRFDIAVGLRQEKLPVTLKNIDVPNLDSAAKVLPDGAALDRPLR